MSAWMCTSAPLLTEEVAMRWPVPIGFNWDSWYSGVNTVQHTCKGDDPIYIDDTVLAEDAVISIDVKVKAPICSHVRGRAGGQLHPVCCDAAMSRLVLYGPLSSGEVLLQIGRAIRRNRYNAFLFFFVQLPKHGDTFKQFVAGPAARQNWDQEFEAGQPVLSTFPLPDPSAGLDAEDVVELARDTREALQTANRAMRYSFFADGPSDGSDSFAGLKRTMPGQRHWEIMYGEDTRR
jgi:hypothetical protein